MIPQFSQSPVVIVNSSSTHKRNKSFKDSCIGKIVIAIFHILTLGCFLKSDRLRNTNVSNVTYQTSQQQFPVYFTPVNHQAAPRNFVTSAYQSRGNVMAYVNPNAAPSGPLMATEYVSHNPNPPRHNPRPTSVPFGMKRG